jgi:hypothetical protein
MRYAAFTMQDQSKTTLKGSNADETITPKEVSLTVTIDQGRRRRSRAGTIVLQNTQMASLSSSDFAFK